MVRVSMPRRLTTLLLVLLVAACSDKPTPLEPDIVVATLVRVVGDSMQGMVAQRHTRLTVRANDAQGNPVAHVPVRFFVPIGSVGTIDTALVHTNSEGLATSGEWTLGTRSGAQHVRVHAQDVATVFTAIALPDAPVALVEYAGNRQVTLAATAVRVPPASRVVDRYGNGVPGVAVQFTTEASSVAANEVVTDSWGVAEAPAWTPSGAASTFSLTARSELFPATTIRFDARVVAVMYQIVLDQGVDALPPRLAKAMDRAAARWISTLTDHVGMSQVMLPAGACGPTSPSFFETVTDLVIFVRVTPIDGRGNVLASALPCAFHEESLLPAAALINFDSADLDEYIANDRIDLVATHEVGHALGFGNAWEQRGLVEGGGSGNPRFAGASASREYGTAFGIMSAPVPLENLGGTGTAGRHWRASAFALETMNGFIVSSRAPLSRITIGAMEDIGYRVDYSAADPFPAVSTGVFGARVEMRHETTALPWAVGNRIMPTVRRVRGR